ncbi:hypothetical protein TRICI_005614 [Trichomonascus ciferrii]|uniref:Uncharacterized protein n=1 Tax=Trichomonascus ciferrii TaxID=44093 RepID=A0A642UTG6_9ASCO|nr:hypothetical protein TRICI_005614 [Trichomonascus ciferrii]
MWFRHLGKKRVGHSRALGLTLQGTMFLGVMGLVVLVLNLVPTFLSVTVGDIMTDKANCWFDRLEHEAGETSVRLVSDHCYRQSVEVPLEYIFPFENNIMPPGVKEQSYAPSYIPSVNVTGYYNSDDDFTFEILFDEHQKVLFSSDSTKNRQFIYTTPNAPSEAVFIMAPQFVVQSAPQYYDMFRQLSPTVLHDPFGTPMQARVHFNDSSDPMLNTSLGWTTRFTDAFLYVVQLELAPIGDMLSTNVRGLVLQNIIRNGAFPLAKHMGLENMTTVSDDIYTTPNQLLDYFRAKQWTVNREDIPKTSGSMDYEVPRPYNVTPFVAIIAVCGFVILLGLIKWALSLFLQSVGHYDPIFQCSADLLRQGAYSCVSSMLSSRPPLKYMNDYRPSRDENYFGIVNKYEETNPIRNDRPYGSSSSL